MQSHHDTRTGQPVPGRESGDAFKHGEDVRFWAGSCRSIPTGDSPLRPRASDRWSPPVYCSGLPENLTISGRKISLIWRKSY